MKRTIGVFLGDASRRVGTLRFDSQGARQSAAFEYDREWLAVSDRFALEPDLPLVTGAQFHKPPSREASIFHGAIADTAPDGWARRVILRDHAKRRALTRAAGEAKDHQPLTPIDFLLAVDDANRVGALRFQDEEGVFQRATGEGQRTAPPLIELSTMMTASRAVETNTETAEDLACLHHLHNHGFLHVAKDQWRLSPAFDINPFPERQRELKTWISEEAGPAASIDALMAVAAYFKLDKEAAVKILAEVERTVSTWRVRGRELGMSAGELASKTFADFFWKCALIKSISCANFCSPAKSFGASNSM
jgi:hypothetical protein